MDIERFKELLLEIGTITGAAKRYCEEFGIEYGDHIRLRFSRLMKKERVERVHELDYESSSTPSFTFSAVNSSGHLMSIEEFCQTNSLDFTKVKEYKLITHTNNPCYNIRFIEPTPGNNLTIEDFEDSISKLIDLPIKKIDSPTEKSGSGTFDRLVLSDIHIGLDPDGGRNVSALYENSWNEKALFNRLSEVIDTVISNRSSSILYIDELGDYTDGLFGKTSRGGHDLPQNMDDKYMFELGVKFKMTLIDNLLTHYDKIICHSITESNHAPLLDYLINSSVKNLTTLKYGEKVEYILCDKFINHYSVGNHTFIITHGKDSTSLRFGMKPYLDTNIIEKIDQYCKEFNLYDGKYIEVAKGDSHRGLFDFTGSNDFEYFNFPAFSPPSNWVSTNFKKSKSGFVFFNIDYAHHSKKILPYWFK